MRYYGIDAEWEQHFRYTMEWDKKFYTVYLAKVEEHTWRLDEHEFKNRQPLERNEVPRHTRWYVDDVVDELNGTDKFIIGNEERLQNVGELVEQTVEDNRHVPPYKTKWRETDRYPVSKDGMEEYEWYGSHNDNFDDQSIYFDSRDIKRILNRKFN